MTVLFDNARRARRVRAMQTAAALLFVGAVYAAVGIERSFGLSPGDGGVLRPLPVRLGVAGLIAGLGLLLLLAMVAYARRYVVRIEREGDHVILTTVGAVTNRMERLLVAEFDSVGHVDPAVEPGASVRTPALLLRIAGRRLPLVVDLQADTVDRRALQALARGR